MEHKELIDYITQTRARGFSDEQIRGALTEAGWQTDEIEQGLNPASNHSDEPAENSLPDGQGFFSKYKKLLITSVLIIIVIPAIAFAGLIVYQKISDSRAAKTAAEQTQAEEQKRNEEQKRLQEEAREKEASRLRDEQRINDIVSLQTALNSFRETNSAYPADLRELAEGEQLAALPFDPDPDKEYLYTPLGDPVTHYTIAVILETRLGSLDPGLRVFSSQNILNKDEVLSQDQTIRGARAANHPDGLTITDLSGSTFKKGEEVSIEIKRADGGDLSYVVLNMDNLKLTDRLKPFSFRFTLPRTAGSYSVQIFGFDSGAQSWSGTTTLTIK